VFPGQQVPPKVLVQEPPVQNELYLPPPEDRDHGLQPREWDVEEGTPFIESVLQNDGVQVGVPTNTIRRPWIWKSRSITPSNSQFAE
jgi:hypothetical protein